MHDWFKQLDAFQKDNGIQDKDLYNFNKTSFAMGLILTARVITRQEIAGRPKLL
jgi:hypothetical protein